MEILTDAQLLETLQTETLIVSHKDTEGIKDVVSLLKASTQIFLEYLMWCQLVDKVVVYAASHCNNHCNDIDHLWGRFAFPG